MPRPPHVQITPSPDNPSIVLIPGSYCPAFFYNDLQVNLAYTAYEVHLDDLPSTLGAPGQVPASLSDDGAHFHQIIEELADQGKDVIVVGHSYGGMVLRESISNLSKLRRQQANLSGGIVEIIYISPILAREGETGMEAIVRNADILTFTTADITEPVDPETEGGPQYLRQIPSKAWEFFFSDHERDVGIKIAAQMTTHTMAAWTTPATNLLEDERKIPVTFIKTMQDVVFPLEFQMRMVKQLQSEGSHVDVLEIDSAHCPNIRLPDELRTVLVKAIEKDRPDEMLGARRCKDWFPPDSTWNG